MTSNDTRLQKRFPKAGEDIQTFQRTPDTPQTRAPAYRLAFADDEFLCRDELRPVRLQLELLKPEMAMSEAGIESTIVVFGSARIPGPEAGRGAGEHGLARYYDEARTFARLCAEKCLAGGGRENVVMTGGGPGIMEAGCRGVADAGGQSVTLNIVLPHEQAPNRWATPEFCFNFHYFAVRKMHFLMRAKAIVAFPGGFGTLDELFETLTLVQTHRMQPLPILLFGRDFWTRVINWEALVEAGTIGADDLELFRFVETAAEAWEAIETWERAAD